MYQIDCAFLNEAMRSVNFIHPSCRKSTIFQPISTILNVNSVPNGYVPFCLYVRCDFSLTCSRINRSLKQEINHSIIYTVRYMLSDVYDVLITFLSLLYFDYCSVQKDPHLREITSPIWMRVLYIVRSHFQMKWHIETANTWQTPWREEVEWTFRVFDQFIIIISISEF